ncbi:MAG: DUF924 family protein [Caulobacter sp.]|nr:DUF924 family protein [Caulobacter sp.]
MPAHPQDIIGFWTSAGPAKWFAKDNRFDEAIRLRFEPVHFAAARGQYDAWRETAEGTLALLLLLDQFPRNLFRDTAHAFATDPLARTIARQALARGFDQQTEPLLRRFFYLPLEHSEDLADQELCVSLCQGLMDDTGDAETLRYAILHRDIIARFGRFPHRNAVFGREMTAEEQVFLEEGGFKG